MYFEQDEIPYRFCDYCNRRFYHNSCDLVTDDGTDVTILTGHHSLFAGGVSDVCTDCASKQGIDVCRGNCMRWVRLEALNQHGQCAKCEAVDLSGLYDNIYITPDALEDILVRTHRDYQQLRYLASEAALYHIPLKNIVKERL